MRPVTSGNMSDGLFVEIEEDRKTRQKNLEAT